jgi:hypothetical protein
MCSPHEKERFFLRMLLAQVKGAINFKAIRTVNGILYNTYEDAARQLGLLDEENNEFNKCIKEAASFKMSSKL